MMKELHNCLCCLDKIEVLLNLNSQPLANEYHDKSKEIKTYPLCLMKCKNCFHCQLSHVVDPTILFKDYKYISGTNNTIMVFFEENTNWITQNKKNGTVLDIACNDGSQLDFFKKKGWNTFGVDPAVNLKPISEKKGHTILCDFWNIESAKKLPIMNIILAQNVFAHTENVDEFLQACKLVMDKDTILYIQTSQKNMIKNNEFDTTYHEHISFFNTLSMNTLVQRNGLYLTNVTENEIHGTSYIFQIKLEKDKFNVENILKKEQEEGLFDLKLYEQFSMNSLQSLDNLKNKIIEYKNNGYKCIGYGASAKGQVVILSGNIELDYIIDENPLKIGLYSPKLNIPIVEINKLKEDTSEKILILLLAWNFSKEIIEKIKKVNKNVVIIKKYLPCLEIIHI